LGRQIHAVRLAETLGVQLVCHAANARPAVLGVTFNSEALKATFLIHLGACELSGVPVAGAILSILHSPQRQTKH
jgi:hypothetical protein